MKPSGAALALLDGVFLPLHINGVTFGTVTYGLPRVGTEIIQLSTVCNFLLISFNLSQVGNQDFANYVDGHLNLTHINNKYITALLAGLMTLTISYEFRRDIIPILPGEIGYSLTHESSL